MEKVALVTGASRGLGLALARALAERGWRLIVDARGADELEAARAELAGATDVIAIAGDVADAGPPRRAARAGRGAGRLDLLVNNASTLGAEPAAAARRVPARRRSSTFIASTSSRRSRSSSSRCRCCPGRAGGS